MADRYDRRTIVRVCQTVSWLAAAMLAIGTAGGWMTREALLAVVFVIGAARSFEQTTLTTLLPGIVPLPMLALSFLIEGADRIADSLGFIRWSSLAAIAYLDWRGV